MSPNIHHISPSHVIRALTPEPYGTYIVRYSTPNDDLISSIKNSDQSKQGSDSCSYVVLSIRVDETIYHHSIAYYRLPFLEQNIKEDLTQLLEPYNQQKNNAKTGKFTPLKHELTRFSENPDWYLDPKHFQDINFYIDHNSGKNNRGICAAKWSCTRQNDINIFIKRFQKDHWYFRHELSLLKEFCYFPIITLHGQYSDQLYSYLVFADGGKSLESCCPLNIQPVKSKMRFISNVGFQVAYAMMYLEQKKVVHRDLTAGNVLIDTYGFIRIADFGHAIKKEEGRNNLEKSMTDTGEKRFQFRFLPPECLPSPKREEPSTKLAAPTEMDVYASFSSKSDVWSFGILLIQLMLPKASKPYPDIDDLEIPIYVKEKRQIHPEPLGCLNDMYLVLKQCWAYEAKNRITFSEIREKMLKLESIFQ
jgi:hypothetical protein